MVVLKPGDRVVIKLKEDKLVSPYSDEFHLTRILEVVLNRDQGYYLFVPHYMFIHGTVTIDKYKCREWSVSPKYLGEEFLFVPDSHIYKVFSVLSGMICSCCGDFYEHAIANQDDGSLICWSCRNRNPK